MTCLQPLQPHADLLGYSAASLVLLTFLMRGMVPLRLMGLASNFAFLAYGFAQGLVPILLLHLLLIPLNIYRLSQISQVRLASQRFVRQGERQKSPPNAGG